LGGADISVKAIRELLASRGFSFSKSLGQNFLVDADIPEKLARLSGVDQSCGVLEIGPGLGALTSALSRRAGQVLAVEIDKRLIPILRDLFTESVNVEIMQGDIMRQDIAKLVSDKMPDMRYHVCANLPYSITTPVLTVLISSGVFETITVMTQKEVARRICAQPGSSEYGAFTVFVNYHSSEAETLFDVNPECFLPRPEVFSSVITIRTRPERLLDAEDELFFFRVTRAAFGHRRKTLTNALRAAFGDILGKTDIEGSIRECGLDAHIRGEMLDLEEFVRLSTLIRRIYGK